MEVVCKGYDTCEDRLECEHSKKHEFNIHCEKTEHNSENCYCSHIFLRKEKLEKLNSL